MIEVHMFKFIVLLFPLSIFANTQVNTEEVHPKGSKGEVVENPTLKTLSGALSDWSLYSSYSYKGGSLEKINSAERPNVRNKEAKPYLAEFTGNLGLKYRLTKQDNLSIQIGIHSTTPFHSNLETDNSQNQSDYDKYGQKTSGDDPTISYFRTYYIGDLQNISFFKYAYVTRDSYREYGGRSIFQYSHAGAYRINKAAYIAGSLNYENYAYDKDTIEYFGRDYNIRESQPEHKYRANLSAEFYLSRKIAIRAITDLFSYTRYRDQINPEEDKRQQTLATTYFFNRDISIAPSVKFLLEDLRADRTNLGLNLNVNL